MNQQFSSAFDVSFIIQASSCLEASFLFSRTVSQTAFSLLSSNQTDSRLLQSLVDAHSLVITEIFMDGLRSHDAADRSLPPSLRGSARISAAQNLVITVRIHTHTCVEMSYGKEFQLHPVAHVIAKLFLFLPGSSDYKFPHECNTYCYKLRWLPFLEKGLSFFSMAGLNKTLHDISMTNHESIHCLP